MHLRSLTGIKPTGEPHVGNWLGAIKPALALCEQYDTFYFIADYHALTTVHEAAPMHQQTLSIAATYLAFGLNPDQSVFYKQSDVPEIFELAWILACYTPKGFMNRAHAYKDAAQKNLDAGKDDDQNINMGLYFYPVLMAADILMFNANVVPVGQDQKQHVEFARDMAGSFNHNYGDTFFVLPEPRIEEQVRTIVGLDGRKMSKSYDNTIPLFLPEKKLQKCINQIVTNSQSPEEPKDPEASAVFALHRLLIDADEENVLREKYKAGGLGWGQAKKDYFECLNAKIAEPRDIYNRLMADPASIEEILNKGRDKARAIAIPFMEKIRKAVGTR
jgi:tryptophanyl-tRNA synthetase